MKILGICGSLRKASYNMMALRACTELMPQGMTLQITSIADIPMYNQDVMDAGMPDPVKRIRGEIAAADGVLLSSPEYNFSVPAPLKNVIDWGSRAPNQVFQDKPVAIISAASPGPLGGARVQYDLRRILTQLWAYPLPRPEVFIGMANTKFDAQGRLTDETTRKFLTDLLNGFRDWIVRMQPKKPAGAASG
jgi:chromate reductase